MFSVFYSRACSMQRGCGELHNLYCIPTCCISQNSKTTLVLLKVAAPPMRLAICFKVRVPYIGTMLEIYSDVLQETY